MRLRMAIASAPSRFDSASKPALSCGLTAASRSPRGMAPVVSNEGGVALAGAKPSGLTAGTGTEAGSWPSTGSGSTARPRPKTVALRKVVFIHTPQP